jgi:hypothetical protein
VIVCTRLLVNGADTSACYVVITFAICEIVQELADVYEEELESRGVKLIWHAEAQRLWQPSEIGRLITPDGIEACSTILYNMILYCTV